MKVFLKYTLSCYQLDKKDNKLKFFNSKFDISVFFVYFEHLLVNFLKNLFFVAFLFNIYFSYKNKSKRDPKDFFFISVVENEHVMPIEVLSDDCLLLIFRYLSIVERIQIERIS